MHVELHWATKKKTPPLTKVGRYFTLHISMLSKSIDARYNLNHFAHFVCFNALTKLKPNDDDTRYKKDCCDDARDASYCSMFHCHSLYASWYLII